MTRFLSVAVLTVVLAALTLVALAPRPVGAVGPISATLSASGNTVTVTPSGAVASDSFCTYTAQPKFTDPTASQITSQYPTLREIIHTRFEAASGGTCPTWTFSIPNPSASASSYGKYTVSVSLEVIDGRGGAASTYAIFPSTGNRWITVTPASSQPAASSSLPAVFWRLSTTAPTAGQSVTATAVDVGTPASFPKSTGCGSSPFDTTDCLRTQIGNGAVAIYTAPVTFTQGSASSTVYGYASVSGGAPIAGQSLWLESDITIITSR